MAFVKCHFEGCIRKQRPLEICTLELRRVESQTPVPETDAPTGPCGLDLCSSCFLPCHVPAGKAWVLIRPPVPSLLFHRLRLTLIPVFCTVSCSLKSFSSHFYFQMSNVINLEPCSLDEPIALITWPHFTEDAAVSGSS